MPNIHSISSAVPVRQDHFFVDSNVWFWVTYCASNNFQTTNAPRDYQLEKYPEFIETILDKGAKLFHCPLVYTELAYIIEKTEYNIYICEQGNDITIKKFRNIEKCRKQVLNKIEIAWKEINNLSTCLDIKLTKSTIPHIHTLLASSKLDSYDALYLKLMQQEKIEKLISDDSDFVETPLIDLYTANNRVLSMK